MTQTDRVDLRPPRRRAGVLIALFATTAALAVNAGALAPTPASATVSQGDDPCAPLAGVDWWAWQDCESNGGGGGGGGGSTAGEGDGSADGGSGSGGAASDNSHYYDESGDDCADYGDCWPEWDDGVRKKGETPSATQSADYKEFPNLLQADCLSLLKDLHELSDDIDRQAELVMNQRGRRGFPTLRRWRRLRHSQQNRWRNLECDLALAGGD